MERKSYFRKTLNCTLNCRENNTEALVISKRLKLNLDDRTSLRSRRRKRYGIGRNGKRQGGLRRVGKGLPSLFHAFALFSLPLPFLRLPRRLDRTDSNSVAPIAMHF